MWRMSVKILFQENGDETELTRKLDILRATELARNDDDRRVMNLIYSQQRFGRPYITTPGVPPARLAALRKAFDDALADPQLNEDAKRLNIRVSLMRGEDLQKVVAELYQTPEALVEKAKAALDITNVVKK
jgi:hypothetical protein